MPDQVPGPIAAGRSQLLHQLGDRMEHTFRRHFLGRTMDVLWETGEAEGADWLWDGLTENYLRVSATGGPALRNVITPARLVADAGNGLRGEILSATGMPAAGPDILPASHACSKV
jgi:tRNA A37 methylthiotransferase MiaB